MNRLIRPIQLMFCFFAFQSAANAQRDLSSGYVVRNNGDTLRGFIEDRPGYQLWRSVRLKVHKEDRAYQEFGTADIHSLQYRGEIYKPVRFKNSQIDTPGVYSGFGNLLVEGYYELFHIYQDNESYFVVRHDTATYFLYQKFDDNGLPVPGGYQNLLNYFSDDCAVNKDILKTNFTEGALSAFMLKVDACLGQGTSSAGVSHYQNARAKWNFVLFAGGLPGNSKSQAVVDAAFRLSFPQWDKQASINMGFRYTSITSTYGLINFSNQNFTVKSTQKISSFPVTFQYRFFPGLIQLYPVVGLSYALVSTTAPYINPLSLSSDSNVPPLAGNTNEVAIIFGGGIEIHPYKELFIRSEFRHETRGQYVVFGLGYAF